MNDSMRQRSPTMPIAAYRAPTSVRTRSTMSWSTDSTSSTPATAPTASLSASSAARSSSEVGGPLCAGLRSGLLMDPA